MSLALLFRYLMLNMFRMLLHPSSGACDNVTTTHIEPEQYNPWNNSTNKSQAPEDGCSNIRTCWALSNEIIKQVTSRWSLFIQMLFHMTLTMVHHTHTYCCTDYSPTSNASKLTQSIQHHFSKTGSAPVFRLASKTCYYISTFISTTRFRKFAGSPQESK